VLLLEPATRSAVAGAAAVRRLHLPEKRRGGRWCEGGKGIRGERRSMAGCARSHLPNLQPITWPRRPRARLGGQSARRGEKTIASSVFELEEPGRPRCLLAPSLPVGGLLPPTLERRAGRCDLMDSCPQLRRQASGAPLPNRPVASKRRRS